MFSRVLDIESCAESLGARVRLRRAEFAFASRRRRRRRRRREGLCCL